MRARRLLRFFVFAIGWGAFAAFTPGTARAINFNLFGQPLRLDLTESMYLSAHLDDGNPDPTTKNYGEMINRLNAQLAWNKFLFSVRFDSGVWVHTPQEGDRSPYVSPPGASEGLNCPTAAANSYRCVIQPKDNRLKDRFLSERTAINRGPVQLGVGGFYLEKIALSYTGRTVEVTLGDFYAQIGRGLVLSIRKVDELGVDTTLTGAKVAVHYKDFSAVALAGFTNIQNFDQAQAQFIADPNDFIGALHLDYRLFGKVLVGAHALFGKPSGPGLFTDSMTKNPDGYFYLNKPLDYYYTLRPGFVLDAPRLTRWLGVYLEYARRQDRASGQDQIGNAFYGAVNLYAGKTSWLLEVKNYQNYQPWHSSQDPFGNLVYMTPPTLEQITTQISQNTDLLAGRLRLDWRASPALNFFYSGQVAQGQPSPDITSVLVDIYGGAEVRWNEGRSHFFPTLGFRNEHLNGNLTTKPNPTGPELEERLWSVNWDAAQILTKRFALEAAGFVWVRQKGLESAPGLADNQWNEGIAYLSLKWAPRFVASVGAEWTTIAQEKYNKHLFFNGSLVWNITPGTSLTLFVGGNRPGLKCVSGVCRVFPAFEGARLEFVLRL